jgi:hypothetical protein
MIVGTSNKTTVARPVVPNQFTVGKNQIIHKPTQGHFVFSAIGQCLKDQYDALAPPISPGLAALVKRLETQI